MSEKKVTGYRASKDLAAHAGMTGERHLPRQTIETAATTNPGESPAKAGRAFTAGTKFNQDLVDGEVRSLTGRLNFFWYWIARHA